MEIKLHQAPVKYITITDWLEPQLHQQILDYVSNKVKYDPGLYGNPDGHTEFPQIKLNNNCWLEYPDPIAAEIQRRCWSPEVVQAILDMNDYLFRAHRLNNLGNFLVSRYDPGDYFAWHADHTHYLTLNYVVQTAEEGGIFEIADQTEDRRLPQLSLDSVLKPVCSAPNVANSLIIFPAMCYHRVTPVVKGQRYTVQYFLSREFPKT